MAKSATPCEAGSKQSEGLRVFRAGGTMTTGRRSGELAKVFE
jgi:hypothetical protein